MASGGGAHAGPIRTVRALRRLAALFLVVFAAACGGGEEAESPATSSVTTETTSDAPPDSYDALLARLPPFDVPASEEVDAYRRAGFESFFGRCVHAEGGASEATFTTANRELLDGLPAYPGAEQPTEFTIPHHDGNGCFENSGPPTSFTTYRTYRLPAAAKPEDVVAFHARHLNGWAPAGGTPCAKSYTRGEALLSIDACGGSLRLTARALERVEIPDPPPLPPRPYGAEYPLAEGYDELPEPASYGVEPGETCERTSGGGVPSIIVPPSPGIRAEWSTEPLELGSGGFAQHVVVEWSFERILGDCPPTSVHVTLVSPQEGVPPLSVPIEVRERSGTYRLPVPDTLRDAYVLRAVTDSIDGTRSRSVAVLIRRP